MSNMIGTRFAVEPKWPTGGFMSRPMGDRRYDVQAFTGRSVSTVARGQWSRGSIARYDAPTFHPNAGPLFMMDPTDPVRFVSVVSTQRQRGMIGGKGKRKRGRR